MTIHIDDLALAFHRFQTRAFPIMESVRNPKEWEQRMAKNREQLKQELAEAGLDLSTVDWTPRDD